MSLIALSAVGACGSPSGSPAGGALAVVAAENFWGDIASQIGGNHVSVTAIVTDPNADPHAYEVDPRAAAAISSASIVIENGLGYDRFIDKLLNTNPQQGRDVISIATTVGASGDNPNPHLWYNPDYVTAAARAIESRLAAHDPADASAFAANLVAFLAAYQPYIATLAAINTKYGGSPVGYTERVPGYLIDRAGLRLATPASFAQSIEDGNDPSPADNVAIDRAMSHKLVKVLLYNSQVTNPTTRKVRELAMANSIPVIGVAETIPAGQPSFAAWQIGQARAILAALGG